MSYYESLGLKTEPFSTSPDPNFFYSLKEHRSVLTRMEIAIRQKRGLIVVIGDVGLGKTTLTRKLFQNFNEEPEYRFHLLLNPSFASEFQFLNMLVSLFRIKGARRGTIDYREAIKNYLYAEGVDNRSTVVLVIDEGQKLSIEILEILRVFLNFETNEQKLLQLIIFAQNELLPKIQKIPNFMDRICFQYRLKPITLEEARELIRFRLQTAGLQNGNTIFTEGAVDKIYSESQGYIRRITLMAHNSLEKIIMEDKNIVDENIVEQVAKEIKVLYE